ncbi:MAG: hypothetical protein K9W44_05770 [Candidatus Lokiarchaeota archaeon]|nr:hypothetical protein [Candidatus Harpocratesius repetitus]
MNLTINPKFSAISNFRKYTLISISYILLFLAVAPNFYYINCEITPNSYNTLIPHIQPSQQSNQIVSLSYNVYYEIHDETKESDEFLISMLINGTNLIYENGTIQYRLSKPILNPTVVNALSFIFGEEQAGFLANNENNLSLLTEFSYRRERLNDVNSNQDFTINSTYTIFWLNSSDRPTNFLHDYQQIPFFQVSGPIMFTLRKDHPDVASPKWSPDIRDLRKNNPILPTYYLTLNLNNQITVKLYYDMTWSLLLRAEVQYVNPNDESNTYFIRMYLESSSLPFTFSDSNPYREEYLKNLTIVLSIIGSIIVIATSIGFLMYRNRKNKAEDRIKAEKNTSHGEVESNNLESNKGIKKKKKKKKGKKLDSQSILNRI